MAALGLAIMVVAGVVTLDVILENTRNTDATVAGQTLSNVDLGGFFSAGVLVGLVGMLGLMLFLAGLKRANRRRLERKELSRSYEGTAAQAETLQQERDRLAAELEQERAARTRAEQAPQHATSTAAHQPQTTGAGVTGTQPTQYADAPATAPVYPTESASAGPAPSGGTGTLTPTRDVAQPGTKPSLKQRLLGR